MNWGEKKNEPRCSRKKSQQTFFRQCRWDGVNGRELKRNVKSSSTLSKRLNINLIVCLLPKDTIRYCVASIHYHNDIVECILSNSLSWSILALIATSFMNKIAFVCRIFFCGPFVHFTDIHSVFGMVWAVNSSWISASFFLV